MKTKLGGLEVIAAIDIAHGVESFLFVAVVPCLFLVVRFIL